MRTLAVLLAVLSLATPASAQYLGPRNPPDGYYERPGYPPPERRHIRFGDRCDAVLRTRHGPERLSCPLIRAKPLGEECGCPPPRGYPGEGFIPGRTVR